MNKICTHEKFLPKLASTLKELGFIQIKNRYFYIEYKKFFLIIWYRKHTFINNMFLLDFGLFFKKLGRYRVPPVETKKWHLDLTFNDGRVFRSWLEKKDEIECEQILLNIKKKILECLFPFIEKFKANKFIIGSGKSFRCVDFHSNKGQFGHERVLKFLREEY